MKVTIRFLIADSILSNKIIDFIASYFIGGKFLVKGTLFIVELEVTGEGIKNKAFFFAILITQLLWCRRRLPIIMHRNSKIHL